MKLLFVLIICCFSKKYVGYKIDADVIANNDLNTSKPTLYHDVNSILKVLKQPQHIQVKGVKELLNLYYEVRNKTSNNLPKSLKRHPLIVIEGLPGSGKTTLVKALSKNINAAKIHSQPPKLKKLKNLSKNNPITHAVCSQLSRYILGLEVERILLDSPVVLDRFWFFTASRLISQNLFSNTENNTLPLKGDKVYNWPNDLLKPDLIIFLKCDEDERLQRLIKRNKSVNKAHGRHKFLLHNYPDFRNNILLIYEYLKNPPVSYFLNGNLPREEVLEEAYSKVKPLLK